MGTPYRPDMSTSTSLIGEDTGPGLTTHTELRRVGRVRRILDAEGGSTSRYGGVRSLVLRLFRHAGHFVPIAECRGGSGVVGRRLPPLRSHSESVSERTETWAVEDMPTGAFPALVRPYLVAHERASARGRCEGSDALVEAAVR